MKKYKIKDNFSLQDHFVISLGTILLGGLAALGGRGELLRDKVIWVGGFSGFLLISFGIIEK